MVWKEGGVDAREGKGKVERGLVGNMRGAKGGKNIRTNEMMEGLRDEGKI